VGTVSRRFPISILRGRENTSPYESRDNVRGGALLYKIARVYRGKKMREVKKKVVRWTLTPVAKRTDKNISE